MSKRKIYIGFATEQKRTFVGLVNSTSFQDGNDELQQPSTIASGNSTIAPDIVPSPVTSIAHPRICISIQESIGDVLHGPDNSMIVHMCNPTQEWNTGIGVRYGLSYPRAHEIYNNRRESLGVLGTCMIIPPSEDQGPKHYIACLFTHSCTKPRKEHCNGIEDATRSAVSDMIYRISILEDRISQIRMCKVWSSNCKLPWKVTRDIISTTSTPEAVTVNVVDSA